MPSILRSGFQMNLICICNDIPQFARFMKTTHKILPYKQYQYIATLEQYYAKFKSYGRFSAFGFVRIVFKVLRDH